MVKERGQIEVQILENTYTLKTDEPPEYVERLAKYVDSKLQRLAKKMTTVSTAKIAILTALDIADELFKSKIILQQRVNKLIKRIDSQLPL